MLVSEALVLWMQVITNWGVHQLRQVCSTTFISFAIFCFATCTCVERVYGQKHNKNMFCNDFQSKCELSRVLVGVCVCMYVCVCRVCLCVVNVCMALLCVRLCLLCEVARGKCTVWVNVLVSMLLKCGYYLLLVLLLD